MTSDENELPPAIMEEIKKHVDKGISNAKLKKIIQAVYSEYKQALADPGESVGIICAESIGEPGTQMTLNTFHFAGVSEMNVTTGLPRLIEILDGRKEISTKMTEIHLKNPWNKGKDIKDVARQVKETTFKEYIKKIDIDMVELTMVISVFKDKELSPEKIAKILGKSVRGFLFRLDKEENIVVKPSTKDASLNSLYQLKEKIKDIWVSGIKGITQVLPVKKGDEFVIMAAGSNLKEIEKLEFVDIYNTTTNDVFEIENHLGIEAARQAIIDEILKVIKTQGIEIDIRHIMLVADTMCMSGKVLGINRYGIVKEKPSVLARASFETPIKQIIDASMIGEVDQLNSVIENVMMNQPVPVGTGISKLVSKHK